MLIQDIVVVPNRGTILIVSSQDPEFEGIKLGTKLQQGSNIWEVVGLERQGSRVTGGILVTPAEPIPERGQAISVVP